MQNTWYMYFIYLFKCIFASVYHNDYCNYGVAGAGPLALIKAICVCQQLHSGPWNWFKPQCQITRESLTGAIQMIPLCQEKLIKLSDCVTNRLKPIATLTAGKHQHSFGNKHLRVFCNISVYHLEAWAGPVVVAWTVGDVMHGAYL